MRATRMRAAAAARARVPVLLFLLFAPRARPADRADVRSRPHAAGSEQPVSVSLAFDLPASTSAAAAATTVWLPQRRKPRLQLQRCAANAGEQRRQSSSVRAPRKGVLRKRRTQEAGLTPFA